MKAFLALIAAFGSVAAVGQGVFYFNTRHPDGGNYIQFFLLNGQPATGPDLFVQVFAGPDAQHLTELTPLLALDQTGSFAGFPSPVAQGYSVPNMLVGQTATVAYEAIQQVGSTTVPLMGLAVADSPVTLSGAVGYPNEVVLGYHTYFLPEPSTWTILLLGMAGLVSCVARSGRTARSDE